MKSLGRNLFRIDLIWQSNNVGKPYLANWSELCNKMIRSQKKLIESSGNGKGWIRMIATRLSRELCQPARAGFMFLGSSKSRDLLAKTLSRATRFPRYSPAENKILGSRSWLMSWKSRQMNFC